MTGLLERIRQDAMTARKARLKTAGVLVTLLGEIERATRNLEQMRAATDADAIEMVRKLLKSLRDNINLLTDAGRTGAELDQAKAERDQLETYLPRQMSEADLETFARSGIADGKDLGALMKDLKAHHDGLYDGKLASNVIRRLLAAS